MMSHTLSDLTQADIRARCTEASFERGQDYYADGAVRQRLRQSETRLAAWVSGTEEYRVTVGMTAKGELETHCTCLVHSNSKFEAELRAIFRAF